MSGTGMQVTTIGGQVEEERDLRHAEEMRPLEEAGQGESEGFELAEQDLIDNASHSNDSTPDPTHLAGEPEDPEAAEAEHGEADEEQEPDL